MLPAPTVATSLAIVAALSVDMVASPPMVGAPTSLVAQEFVDAAIPDVVLLNAPAPTSVLERASSTKVIATGGAPVVEVAIISPMLTSLAVLPRSAVVVVG